MTTTPTHHDPDALTAAALEVTRRAGCTCAPTVDLTELHPGEYRAQVAHAHACHLLTTRCAPWN